MVPGASSILVVDDQDGVRQLLLEILRGEGFNVSSASNGFEAMDALENSCPDLILVDMKMPGMSGLDVLREIKQRRYPCLPIMMTAYGELEIANEAMKLGVKHFINKPFDIDDFRQAIRDVLEGNDPAAAG